MGKIDFGKGFHPEFHGWLHESEDVVYISFISAKKESKGRGNFSKLIQELKEKYNKIVVPTPSDMMKRIVIRKGFLVEFEYDEEHAESFEAMVWRKIKDE